MYRRRVVTATDDRLADLLDVEGVEPRMVRRVRQGYYSDTRSGHATPKNLLVDDLKALNLTDLAGQVATGEFNDTTQDIKEWFLSPEGLRFLREHFPSITRVRWQAVFTTERVP